MIPLFILAHTVEGAPIEMSPKAAMTTYAIAELLMELVDKILSFFGMGHDYNAVMFTYAVLVFLIASGIGWVLKWIMVKILRMLQGRINLSLYVHLREVHFFTKICSIIPPVVFLILIEFTMRGKLYHVLMLITFIYIVVVTTIALAALVDGIWRHIDERDNKRKLPLKGLVQLVKGILWIIAVIVICAILLHKSPTKLIAGLGAFAAVLMLIFKDSILGVVAGVQLSENDTLHVGDWIKVHGTDANGIVQEVTLTAVKIQNFDKTVTTMPPYTLVSGSFTNMRSMQESGTRRIQRCYFIDADSIAPLTDEILERVKNTLPMMRPYIEAKQKMKNPDSESTTTQEHLADGTIDTNLGLFRAYLEIYLNNNSNVDHASTCFVTTLQQTPTGVPLQIYCFTNTSSWLPYEAIQAAIFEHIAVTLHCFGLYCYESASGRDTIVEGLLAKESIDNIFGIPYPINMQKDILTGYRGSQTPPASSAGNNLGNA